MLGVRIRKLILLRTLVAALLLYAPRVFPNTSEEAFYGVSSGICLLNGGYLLWYLTRRWLRQLALFQIVLDLLLETYLVYATGGMESLFATFYILSILSSALVLGTRRVILLSTAMGSMGYFGVSLAGYRSHIDPLIPRDPVYFLYGTAVRIVIFFVVGHLARYLTGKVIELQEQLKLSERLSLLGEAASKIAHEVRNPLSSIRTAAEVLRDSLAGKLTVQDEKMITIVESESDRLTKTLQRILGYAKQTAPNPKMLLFDSLVDRTLSLVQLQSQPSTNGVRIEKKYEPGRVHVYADEEQILSAFLNLTLNAYQAMPQGGALRIGAIEDLHGTKIRIEDDGGGIPPDQLKDLFTPFKSTKKGGTGLGLAEVRKIITHHEGKVDVETVPGRGTTFHLFFPKP